MPQSWAMSHIIMKGKELIGPGLARSVVFLSLVPDHAMRATMWLPEAKSGTGERKTSLS